MATWRSACYSQLPCTPCARHQSQVKNRTIGFISSHFHHFRSRGTPPTDCPHHCFVSVLHSLCLPTFERHSVPWLPERPAYGLSGIMPIQEQDLVDGARTRSPGYKSALILSTQTQTLSLDQLLKQVSLETHSNVQFHIQRRCTSFFLARRTCSRDPLLGLLRVNCKWSGAKGVLLWLGHQWGAVQHTSSRKRRF